MTRYPPQERSSQDDIVFFFQGVIGQILVAVVLLNGVYLRVERFRGWATVIVLDKLGYD